MRLALLTLLFIFAQNSTGAVLTFDNSTVDPFVSVESEGFLFTGQDIQIHTNNHLDGNAVAWSNFPPSEGVGAAQFEMSAVSGAVFDLLSFDTEEVFFGLGATADLFGFTAAGGIVNRTISFPSYTLNSFVFDSTWANLERLEIHLAGPPAIAMALDNIAVNVIPIPAAVWLFGSALAGLGWMRRKQTV